MVLFVMGVSFTFVGCEGGDDNDEVITTNTTTSVHSDGGDDDGDETTTQSATSNDGGGNNNPPPVVPAGRSIIVDNKSASAVSVTVAGAAKNIAAGSMEAWFISGASTLSYDSGLGGAKSATIGNDSLTYSYELNDSASLPGLITLSGGAQN